MIYKTMKKKITFLLLTAIVGLFVVTGCQKEQPFSYYQIGATFSGIDYSLTQAEIDKLPIAENERYEVALYLDRWLINNSFVQNEQLGNPIVVLTADEEYNDEQATREYNNMVVELNEVDEDNGLDKIIIEAQKKLGSDGNPLLTLTTSGSISFKYHMLKGSARTPRDDWNTQYAVSYGELSETPNP